MSSMNLGDTIKELMRQRGMRLTQIARLADVNPGQLSQIINGKAFPSIESLTRIAKALGVSPGRLLDGRIDEGNEFTLAVEHLAVALYSFQKLDSNDQQKVRSVIDQVVALMNQSNQVVREQGFHSSGEEKTASEK